MGRKKRYIDKAYCSTIGEDFNDGVWLLETRTYKKNAWGQVEVVPFHGTGFLFKRKTAFLTRCFLVSNKHLLVEGNPHCLLLKIPPITSHGSIISPAVTYQLYPSKGKSLSEEPLASVVHAHPTLDLAIIDVTEKIRELQKEFKYRNFKVDSLEEKNLPLNWDIQQDRPTHYLGFPDEQIYPTHFKGNIKRNPKYTSDIELTALVAQGASGSPAFLNGEAGTYPKFLGVIESTESMEMEKGGVRQYVFGHAVKSCDLLAFINDVLHKKGFHM